MSINPDIRDQAYQFFIEEARELLHVIESGLLTLRQERSTAKVHDLMRAAHSIKGGAASVELDAIKTLAHRLEDIFKALYSEEVEIDTALESLLLQAYDCLRLPLMEQIEVGALDSEAALTAANPIFAQIEERLGDALTQAENYIPSSADLGVDMVSSLFEVDVTQGLERLADVVARPQAYEVAGELRAQAEVFAGFAEFLNLPGFGAIAQAAIAALDAYPEHSLLITQLALADFTAGQQAVLAGDRSQGGNPSAALMDLVPSRATNAEANDPPVAQEPLKRVGEANEEEIFQPVDEAWSANWLEDILSSFVNAPEGDLADPDAVTETEDQTTDAEPGVEEAEEMLAPSLEDVFGSADVALEMDAEATNLVEDEVTAEIGSEAETGFEDTDVSVPNLEDVFDEVADPLEATLNRESAEQDELSEEAASVSNLTPEQEPVELTETPESLKAAVQSIEQIFEDLPPIQADADIQASADVSADSQPDSSVPAQPLPQRGLQPSQQSSQLTGATNKRPSQSTARSGPSGLRSAPLTSARLTPTNLSIRVDLNRLERMNNLVGELAINRNSLSLQNEQLQRSVRELLARFARFQNLVGHLQELSDQMLIAPFEGREKTAEGRRSASSFLLTSSLETDFDSLEMDSYGKMHSLLQGLLEEVMQLEEAVDDVALFSGQSDQTIEQQRFMLTQMRDELMWARMLPVAEVLNRFPRVLRDLSTTHGKPVNLKLSGTGVFVDKAVLEKLYDPLLHLLRNAFDHGIEPPEIRRQQGKSEQGQIEIRAYHRGNQTLIEVRDDGQGLNLEQIGDQALEQELLTEAQLAVTTPAQLSELIFEPGFSTAPQVSELSGRGVGLDAVRAQLRSLKGTISVNSSPGQGTIFTLRLPLTLTIAKLLVCLVDSAALALPSDSIEEIIIPQSEQIKQSGTQRFLHWRGEMIPVHRLADLLDYTYPLPEASPSKALSAVSSPEDWALPLLILRQEQQVLVLEINRLVSEQELVIKPFGTAIASPRYLYGCTIIGDGSLVPVIDGAALLNQALDHKSEIVHGASVQKSEIPPHPSPLTPHPSPPTVLVVDDSATLRRTLALTLQKVGYRVLQARDGREALEQLQQSSTVQLVVCDIEMPNMNGFEFLSQRRRDPELSKVPVAMLTSRGSEKHRQLAMRLGAIAYFTKPYIEQEFLVAIKGIMSQSVSESKAVLR